MTSADNKPAISAQIQEIFGTEGSLAQHLPAYEFRPGQLEMAEAVVQAIKHQEHLVVEAGTGTGKSLAYLIPGILSRKQVVISTLTKNLQEQLFYKDIPFLHDVLKLSFSAASLKGRANYLCLRRYYNFLRQPYFDFREEAQLFNSIRDWTTETQTGDRVELTSIPDNYMAWSFLNSTTETCIGKKCPQRSSCFFEKAKKKAHESDLIIINHHLFFADLSLKKRTRFQGVLPEIDLLILDEAHEIEDVATSYFGIRFSYWQLHRLIFETERILLAGELGESVDNLRKLLNQFDDEIRLFFNQFRIFSKGKFRLTRSLWTQEISLAYTSLQKQIQKVSTALKALRPKNDEIDTLISRWKKINTEADEITDLDRDDMVYWVEVTPKNVVLASAPIELAAEFAQEIFQKIPAIIMTSATLSTNNNFDFFKKRIGLEGGRELIVESPFDMKKQTTFFVPRDAPDPRKEQFDEFVIETVQRILKLTRGKAFVLFTSRRRMEITHARLAESLPFQSYVQGEKPKHQLIEAFKQDINSVLFATSSFWHGVDVAGRSLSCVIIDKIPFSVPDEPVIEARIEYIQKIGGNAFMDFMVPSAIITLKQGLGRLIRARTDYGILILLDRRILYSSYGYLFRNSLPALTLTTDEHVLQQMAKAIQQNKEMDHGAQKKK